MFVYSWDIHDIFFRIQHCRAGYRLELMLFLDLLGHVRNIFQTPYLHYESIPSGPCLARWGLQRGHRPCLWTKSKSVQGWRHNMLTFLRKLHQYYRKTVSGTSRYILELVATANNPDAPVTKASLPLMLLSAIFNSVTYLERLKWSPRTWRQRYQRTSWNF